ncbi:hypothetical protein C5Y97_11110 [Blastopirellula marina]|uniref:FHA domain-containing protein n=2 Tax=Blastopirellula marina TaxID=124 RepID=A0A2S8G2B4_9BACT|nr:hypothetical protein C5Y98_11100 [Blastopirellula marina]PTL45243.1 hypothetical protein C5Y97_11110 [Blastopirellula marina]
MRAFLTVQHGPAKGETISAEPGMMLRVGRQANADLTIGNDHAMSGLHFALLCDKNRCRLRDLNSTNGTFVNGIRVNLVELYDRDTIRAGNSEFQVRFEGEINTTVIDPLMYPEVQRLREKDAQKGNSPLGRSPSAIPVNPLGLDSTDELSPEITDLANAISAEQEQQSEETELHCDSPKTDSQPSITRLNVSFEDATRKRQIWLTPGQTVIVGRNQMSDITVVGDASISGVHFALDCEENRCRLRDLQSQNGITLNGVSVPYATIYTGDKFIAGTTEFQVTIDGGQEAPDAPLRTWVFEDLVRRKFATFYAKDIGTDYHLVDAVGIEPLPIELLRRLARHRDIGVIVDGTEIRSEVWEKAAQETFACDPSAVKVVHMADIEKVIEPLHQEWGKNALAFLFPYAGQEGALADLAPEITAYIPHGRQRAGFGNVGDWVMWLSESPSEIPKRLPHIEAVFIQHPDARRWRMLCDTDFISQLNRLGYLPSHPSPLLEQEDDLSQ